MDRRGFLRAFGVGAAGGSIIHNIPEAKAYAVEPGKQVPSPGPQPIDALAKIEAKLRILAAEAAAGIQAELKFPLGILIHKSPHVGTAFDTVIFPGGRRVRLTRHMESTVAVPDIEEVLDNPALQRAYMVTAQLALAESITDDCKGRSVLCYAKHPLILRGIGAISARCEARDVSVRAVLSYDPDSMRHRITIDTLYGVA
jgi:hypothetical protein